MEAGRPDEPMCLRSSPDKWRVCVWIVELNCGWCILFELVLPGPSVQNLHGHVLSDATSLQRWDVQQCATFHLCITCSSWSQNLRKHIAILAKTHYPAAAPLAASCSRHIDYSRENPNHSTSTPAFTPLTFRSFCMSTSFHWRKRRNTTKLKNNGKLCFFSFFCFDILGSGAPACAFTASRRRLFC